MDDLVNLFDVKAGYFMQITGYQSFENPKIRTRQYRHYECPNCGLFLAYRTKVTFPLGN